MADSDAGLSPSLSSSTKDTPYWWDDVRRIEIAETELPKSVDVAIIGSGYTGLNAALETARGGRDTLVLDAEAAGWGCSTRNGGQISTSVKPSLDKLSHRFGRDRAKAIRGEGETALTWIEEFVKKEGIDCDFQRCGRFHAAHTPENYELLVRDSERLTKDEGIEAFAVPREEQRRELGTDTYFGGVVYPRHASLHPAKYHRGLVECALGAGVRIVEDNRVLSVERDGAGFRLSTEKGELTARNVIIATNGYIDGVSPWLRRRVIPIGSYIVATDELPKGMMDELFPTDRIASDTCRVVYYYRASPDRKRILFGGRVSARETNPMVSGSRLLADLVQRFPELTGVSVSHSWAGTVAYSFDELAHTGERDGIHYALGYCGSGVSMASYLGMRVGQKVLGLKEGTTAFDNLPFPTRPLYNGTPWFLPAVVAYYRWQDQREQREALKVLRS